MSAEKKNLPPSIILGDINSRIKNFYNLWLLLRTQRFDGNGLVKALTAAQHELDKQWPPGGPWQ